MAAERKEGLVGVSLLLFLLTMGNSVCGFALHAVASRVLGPEDYGAFVSLLALLMILAVPSQAVQMIVAKQITLELIRNQLRRAVDLTWQAVRWSAAAGMLLWLAVTLALPVLKSFLHLPSASPLLAVGAAIVLTLITPVLRGFLQGTQRFQALGWNFFLEGVGRLAWGALFLLVGWGVLGAVLASAAGALTAALIAVWLLGAAARGLDRNGPEQPAARTSLGLQDYGWLVLVTMAAFFALSNLDVLIVKHLFPQADAGYYSAGSLIGKAFLFLPYTFAQVLFPKASRHHALGESTLSLLNRSLLYTAAALLLGMIAVYALAPVLLSVLFGPEYNNPTTLRMIRYFGVAMTPLALVYVMMQYSLALKNAELSLLMLADLPVFIILLMTLPRSLEGVLLAMGLNFLILAAAGYAAIRAKAQPLAAEA